MIVSERAARQAWLEARGYKMIRMTVVDVERDLETELAKVEASLGRSRKAYPRAVNRAGSRPVGTLRSPTSDRI